jgi:hypothetical protein
MKYSKIELTLPAECVRYCGLGVGSKDSDIEHWLAQPEIANQFENLKLEDSARILYGYGCWEVEELKDLETNKKCILWLAATAAAEEDSAEYAVGEDAFVMLEGHGYDKELAELRVE